MDNTKKFTDKADKYVSSRPSYPTKLMNYLTNTKKTVLRQCRTTQKCILVKYSE